MLTTQQKTGLNILQVSTFFRPPCHILSDQPGAAGQPLWELLWRTEAVTFQLRLARLPLPPSPPQRNIPQGSGRDGGWSSGPAPLPPPSDGDSVFDQIPGFECPPPTSSPPSRVIQSCGPSGPSGSLSTPPQRAPLGPARRPLEGSRQRKVVKVAHRR